MSSSNRLIVAMLVVAVLAGGFWILILSPKREEANSLAGEVDQLKSSLSTAQTQAAEAAAAREKFPADYRQLVTLGKAVPAEAETASLLVELNRIADRSNVKFESILLSSESSESAATPTAPEAGPTTAATATVPPTEAAAALLPLGAAIGPAGLAVMPYDLTFQGGFSDVADFIHGIDSLVETHGLKTSVDGRLVTLDGFVLTENNTAGFPALNADFSVTTYLIPPGESTTAGATVTEPAAVEAPAGTSSSSSTAPAQ
jgi:Tfp pilus assembly protein PilO